MAASSFSRCGRLPVFSSCSITATTISSFMPSVSIFTVVGSRGDGGGVVSGRRLAVGRGSCLIFGDKDFEVAVGEAGADGADDKLSRFSFFGGGWSSSEERAVVLEGMAAAAVAGGERCEDRQLFGMWMPRSDSETDLRLVLYGMVDISTGADGREERRLREAKRRIALGSRDRKLVGKARAPTVDKWKPCGRGCEERRMGVGMLVPG